MASPDKAHYQRPPRHTRDIVRQRLRDDDLSHHTWVTRREWVRDYHTGEWHLRADMVCPACGYVWKPDMPRPTKDCEPGPVAS